MRLIKIMLYQTFINNKNRYLILCVSFRKFKRVHLISIMRLMGLNWALNIKAAPVCRPAEDNNHKVADAAKHRIFYTHSTYQECEKFYF